MPIRIVIADDHPVVRRGLSQYFADEEELEVVAECADGESALAETARLLPDVLIVDLRMPLLGGMDVLRRMKESLPAVPVGSAAFYACWFLTAACTSGWFGPLFATIQELSPAHTRSTAVAFALLVLNLLGVGPGPLLTGKIGDVRSLTLGLLTSAVVVVLAVVPFALAARAPKA